MIQTHFLQIGKKHHEQKSSSSVQYTEHHFCPCIIISVVAIIILRFYFIATCNNPYPMIYGQAISIQRPSDTNLAPDWVIGGREVTNRSNSFISSSENL